jgi:hypothetical protein
MRVVARRRIDNHLFLIGGEPTSYLRRESVRVHSPVRNVGFVPQLGPLAWDLDSVTGRVDEIRYDPVVLGVNSWLAAIHKAVEVDFRLERLGVEAPDAALSPGHGDGFGYAFEVQLDLRRSGIFKAESDAMVRMQFV